MAINNYSTDLLVVTVNGLPITDWGEGTPFRDEPIDPKSTLRRGQGGGGSRLDRLNPGRRVTLNIQPGSPNAAYLSSLMNSRANVSITRTQIGTLESAVGSEGIFTNDGPNDRGGQTITDDQFIMEFNSWTDTKGG